MPARSCLEQQASFRNSKFVPEWQRVELGRWCEDSAVNCLPQTGLHIFLAPRIGPGWIASFDGIKGHREVPQNKRFQEASPGDRLSHVREGRG